MDLLYKILGIILNPLSPIVTLVVGFLLNIISNQNYSPDWLKQFYNKPNFLFALLILWLLATFLYLLWRQREEDYKEQIKKLRSELESKIIILQHDLDKKNREIEQNSAYIISKYSELAKFNTHQKMISFLKSLVDSNCLIESAQIYKYTFKMDEKQQKVVLKLNFEEGYAYERIEINNILQTYYEFSLDHYKGMQEISKLRKLTADDYIADSEDIINTIYDNMIERSIILMDDLYAKLEDLKISYSSLSDENAIYLRLLLILLELSQGALAVEGILPDSELESTLLSRKRTGILGAILLEDAYVFKHNGKSSKKGRMYLSLYFSLYKENYVCLLSLPTQELISSDNWSKEIGIIKKNFDEMINGTFH